MGDMAGKTAKEIAELIMQDEEKRDFLTDILKACQGSSLYLGTAFEHIYFKNKA